MNFHSVADSIKVKLLNMSLRSKVISAVTGLVILFFSVEGAHLFGDRHVIFIIKNKIVSPNAAYLPSVLNPLQEQLFTAKQLSYSEKPKDKEKVKKLVLNKDAYFFKIKPGESFSVTFSYPHDGQYLVNLGLGQGAILWYPVYFQNGNEYLIELSYGSYHLNGMEPVRIVN